MKASTRTKLFPYLCMTAALGAGYITADLTHTFVTANVAPTVTYAPVEIPESDDPNPVAERLIELGYTGSQGDGCECVYVPVVHTEKGN